MKDLQWKDEYLVGILPVDLQHQRIFDCFITIAEGSTKHDTLLAEFALAKLVGLVRDHFALEESMMRTLLYPELERHIEEHRHFHAEVHDLAQRSLKIKESVPREAIKVAQKWLRDHIMTSDRHYVDFFSNSAQTSGSTARGTSY